MSTPPPCQISRLPQELVEQIISYFIYNNLTLLACSMTCTSWYIAAVPHLPHTLTIHDWDELPKSRRYMWPRPLKISYELGLLPLVKRFRICLRDSKFTPKRLNWFTLRYFSALTNLQELGIDYLQVSTFMPIIQQCFGHLSPNLRFLALKDPNGTRRQILYFIGLFANLQDLKLQYSEPMDEPEDTADATLIPLSTPPLQGWLRLVRFTKEDLVKDMVTLFGGLRFRCMDLFEVSCSQLLLNECAETLETLRLYSTDVHGEKFVKGRSGRTKEGRFVANPRASQGFNLSRNKSLRTLKTTTHSMDFSHPAAPDFLKAVLSSITSPALLDVVVIFRNDDFNSRTPCRLCAPQPVHEVYHHYGWMISDPDIVIDRFFLNYRSHFTVFQEMHSVRGFWLVFCMDVSDCVMRYALGELESVLRGEEGSGGFDYLLYGPVVTCERRVLRTGPSDSVLRSMTAMPPASAL